MAAAAAPARAQTCTPAPDNPRVRFETVLGDFDVELCALDTPVTVANFLDYVRDGDYGTTGFVHRRGGLAPGSPPVIQGGGYLVADTPSGPAVDLVPTEPPIPLEVGLSNLRGTIAMARTSEPDTATSQWFVNLADNVALDTSLGGFAVFGEVIAPGMATVDAIAAQQVWNAGAPFNELPLIDYPGSGPLFPHLVYVHDVRELPAPAGAPGAAAAVAALAAVGRLRRRRTPHATAPAARSAATSPAP